MLTGLLFSVLVYPGLLFLIVFSLFSQWFRRKLIARIQKRIGPKLIGPFGILQPYVDIYKLILSKEISAPMTMSVKLVTFFPFLGIAAVASSLLLTPFSPFSFFAKYDVIVFIYLMLISSLSILLLSIGSTSIYPNIGAARYIAIILIAEPILAITLIGMVKILAPESLSLYEALYSPNPLWKEPILAKRLAYISAFLMAALAFSLALMCKALFRPFDIAEAKTEIAGGIIAELSGPLLGLYILLHEMELTVYLLIFSNLLLPIPSWPQNRLFPPLSLLKYFIVLSLFITISTSMGRLRLDQALKLLVKYAIPLGIISITVPFIF